MAEYVDKNEVYRAARESMRGEGLIGVVAIAIFETAIDRLPAAQMGEARHAEWEHYDDRRVKCTNCEFVAIGHYRYCPGCGARMDGNL